MRDHDERNRRSRERMAALAARMGADDLRRPLGEHWTIAAGLMHISSWDRFVFERWTHADANGLAMPVSFSSGAEDVVNGTLTPLLMKIPAEEAIELALETALAVEQLIAGLSTERVETALRQGRERMVDRSIHRIEHL
ncbi:MAG: DinB family protein, partial [Chloroflexota bacterium]|nr:DinB family protein [Chloroflexota bacterium]